MVDKDNTERLGVNAVESIFLDMKWKFREQAISDYGIDAHVELCDHEGKPTGQLIALQIKSGKSYFKKRGEDFVFHGEERHLQYWQNHVLPVFIILHDPETGLTLWQQVVRSEHERLFQAAFDTNDLVIANQYLNTTPRQSLPELTLREKECLLWTLDGKTANEVAKLLNLSVFTVNHHASTAAQKLGCTSKHHAAVQALRAGLI